MIAYASRTGTRRNLAALRAAGWRLMVSAKGVQRTEDFDYAIDNGAWWAYRNGKSFDEAVFLRCVEKLGAKADFIVIPDIVAGGLRSLEFSLSWIDRLRGACPRLMLAVQDGMVECDVREHVGRHAGVFLGGSTEWKLRTMIQWGVFASMEGAPFHVGRVNSLKRIRMCAAAGADSFDGSSASRFAKTLPLLDHGRRQPDMFAARPFSDP